MEPSESNTQINNPVPESTANQPTQKESEDSNETKTLQLEQEVQTQEEELANRIVNIDRTVEVQTGVERAEKTPENEDVEKSEEEGRKLLRLALLATGIGTGVLASNISSEALATVGLVAVVLNVGSQVVKSVAEAKERSLGRESEEKVSNIVERCKDIAWLSNPMLITSIALGIFKPEFDTGIEVDIKTWLDITIDKIKTINLGNR